MLSSGGVLFLSHKFRVAKCFVAKYRLFMTLFFLMLSGIICLHLRREIMCISSFWFYNVSKNIKLTLIPEHLVKFLEKGDCFCT